ncbi:helix-turn-helix transcriptional regulator [Roseisolibacter sp. H3M3-2]|uniref:helix-turn-helix domain-containing protein n=1 Tax=Roseisolibacter sp. H3M3-2 TaxID=3031323 RepID=UPI0023DA29F5|nr:helix-turn-helix transcriptional regulator [Roseisolibacter sp. H3M3-2]MDF1501556.1 helix-turn-helix transcriptional regulator [Roseisolibacter sp. H3M3-2]
MEDDRSRKPFDGADLGGRVRVLRERRGLSLRELARRAGVQVSDVSRLERGLTRQPRLTLAMALAGALGVRLSHLLGETEGGAAEPSEAPVVAELRLALEGIGREAARVAQLAERAAAMLEEDRAAVSAPPYVPHDD